MRNVKCDICGKDEDETEKGILSGEDQIENIGIVLPDFFIDSVTLNKHSPDMCEECAIKEFNKQILEVLNQ